MSMANNRHRHVCVYTIITPHTHTVRRGSWSKFWLVWHAWTLSGLFNEGKAGLTRYVHMRVLQQQLMVRQLLGLPDLFRRPWCAHHLSPWWNQSKNGLLQCTIGPTTTYMVWTQSVDYINMDILTSAISSINAGTFPVNSIDAKLYISVCVSESR